MPSHAPTWPLSGGTRPQIAPYRYRKPSARPLIAASASSAEYVPSARLVAFHVRWQLHVRAVTDIRIHAVARAPMLLRAHGCPFEAVRFASLALLLRIRLHALQLSPLAVRTIRCSIFDGICVALRAMRSR